MFAPLSEESQPSHAADRAGHRLEETNTRFQTKVHLPPRRREIGRSAIG
jgi:hypothetical protein